MASSVSVTYQVKATVVESLDAAKLPGALNEAARKVEHAGWDTAVTTLTGASSPPATLSAFMAKALVAGAATVDLTALVGTNNLTIDGTGLRVQILRVKNPLTNANPITVKKGAANGYDAFGANFSVEVAPGGEATLYSNDAGSNIGATNKNLDLVGTLVQVLNVEIVLG